MTKQGQEEYHEFLNETPYAGYSNKDSSQKTIEELESHWKGKLYSFSLSFFPLQGFIGGVFCIFYFMYFGFKQPMTEQVENTGVSQLIQTISSVAKILIFYIGYKATKNRDKYEYRRFCYFLKVYIQFQVTLIILMSISMVITIFEDNFITRAEQTQYKVYFVQHGIWFFNIIFLSMVFQRANTMKKCISYWESKQEDSEGGKNDDALNTTMDLNTSTLF